jgi:uncharacterized protein YjbI with pentapeptide repeats
MANNEQKTCQELMRYGIPCGRLLYDGEKCICHSEKEDKDVGLFQEELDKIFANDEAEYYDLTHFVFPRDDYRLPREYKKDTFFLWATFSGEADFSEATFSGEADFWSAMFSGDADFREATFSGNADFREATFSGKTWFHSTRFKKPVGFAHCKVAKEAEVVFDGEELREVNEEMFLGEADFTSCSFAEPKNIKFRKVSLQKCKFLETDVSAVQFVDVTWEEKPKYFGLSSRNAVHDEVSNKTDNNYNLIAQLYRRLQAKRNAVRDEASNKKNNNYSLIAQLYRRLQANYINNYNYAEASDFYIGEQEMMRKAKGKIRQYLSTSFLYKLISYYGESYWQPLILLSFVLLFFTGIFLYNGINLGSTPQASTVAETVNYEWSWSPRDFLLVKSDYWEAFAVNFLLITFIRSEISEHLPSTWMRFVIGIESLIVIALVTFIILALRRRFKRKTF